VPGIQVPQRDAGGISVGRLGATSPEAAGKISMWTTKMHVYEYRINNTKTMCAQFQFVSW